MMNEIELSYLAGLFDAESSMLVSVHKNDSCNLGYFVTPKVSIEMKVEPEENKTRELVQKLIDEVGSESEIHIVDRDDEWSKTWSAQFNGKYAIEVLETLHHQLRLKQQQADVLLSVDWDNVNRSQVKFMEAIEVKEKLGKMHGHNNSKYDVQYFKEEFSPEADSAAEVSW